MVSSHQTRELQYFAGSSNIEWNPPTIYGPDLIATILQMSLPSLFLQCGVDQQYDSRIILHKTRQILGNFQCKWLSASYLAPRTFASFFVFPAKFLFCTDKTVDPLGGQVLHHDCISVIVSRFAIFTENFVICWYQVTKIFCTKYGSAIASSARGPCNFGPFTDLAISVFREMSFNTVLAQILISLGCGL